MSRIDYDTDGFRLSDLDPDPLVEAVRWLDAAIAAGEPQPETMHLATVSAQGVPSVRAVLLRGIDTGFVFYTNYLSDKGVDIAATSTAALSIAWVGLHRQIRAQGRVERTSDATSDEYWQTRPRGAQLAAAASQQSRPLPDRETLERLVEELDESLGETPVPRPAHWGGYRLLADRVELWQGRNNRMHDRVRYERRETAWVRERLYP